MKKTVLTVTVALAAAIAVSAVALASGGAAAGRPALVLHKTQYGRVLFNGQNRALYVFGRDKGRSSSCYGACAKAWPPYVVTRKPSAGAGVRSGLIGTIRRKDGRLQVTYAGHPLYFYQADPKGKANCQKVTNFGGIWLVVAPSGKAIR